MEKTTIGKIMAFLAVWLLLCCTGCANLKDIRNISITSFNVKSLSVKGFDSAEAVLEVTVDNPAKEIKVSSVEGTAYRSGKALGTFTLSPFSIEGRTSSTVEVGSSLELAPSFSPLTLMSIASDFNASEFTMDISIRAKVGKSPQKKFTMKDIPVENIIKRL